MTRPMTAAHAGALGGISVEDTAVNTSASRIPAGRRFSDWLDELTRHLLPVFLKAGLRRAGHDVTRKIAAILSRASSGQSAEYVGKVLLGFETAGDGNIQHAHIGRAQHLFSALDSDTQYKLMRCFSG